VMNTIVRRAALIREVVNTPAVSPVEKIVCKVG
jgi:hypothetical protein